MFDPQKEIENNIRTMKPDWTKLDMKKTDRGLQKDKPQKFKLPKDNATIIGLSTVFPNITQKTLTECIQERRSLRKYADTQISFEELSYLLFETSRVKSHKGSAVFRTIPTGGATNGMETYFYSKNVEGLEEGIYLYLQDKHAISLGQKAVDLETKVNDALQRQLRDAPIVFFFTAVPYRSVYKYSFTAHKMLLLEAGHACQNLSLASEVIESGCVALCAYNQTLSDQLLDLDGLTEFVTYIVPLGKK